jgi:tetratricopeptide (TPR) repeat protein
LGSVFFGGVPELYNLKLAQKLFLLSADPILPVRTPRYAHYQLARTYFIEGKLLRALDEANKELAEYPENTRTYYMLGLIYGYLNRESEAIAAFATYISIYPGSWPARNDMAWLQFRVGDIDGALQTLEPAIASFRNTPWVQNTYCALLIAKARYDEAKTPCLRAKDAAEKMTEADWGRSYPGNDPRMYSTGIHAMRSSIEKNLRLIESQMERAKTPL